MVARLVFTNPELPYSFRFSTPTAARPVARYERGDCPAVPSTTSTSSRRVAENATDLRALEQYAPTPIQARSQ
jgi:hypothetical protein